jgi:DNA primase
MKDLTAQGVLRNKTGRKSILYLMHRNFTPQHIIKYQLKYCDQWDCFQCFGSGKDEDDEKCGLCNGSGKNPYYDWLIIPSYENTKMVYYIGRNLDKESDFRYRNPKNLAKSQVVFFYDLLKESDRIFIVEGPMDAMTLYDYSVACIMGNRISDPQVQKLLKKNPKQIIFIPDYDETAEKRQIIGRALKKNIESVRKFDSKVEIGVYRWYKKYGDKGKDLNDINHTKIEEDLISMKNFKGEVLDKLEGIEQR